MYVVEPVHRISYKTARLRSACASPPPDHFLHGTLLVAKHPKHLQADGEVLIRLRECAGRSETSLAAHVIS